MEGKAGRLEWFVKFEVGNPWFYFETFEEDNARTGKFSTVQMGIPGLSITASWERNDDQEESEPAGGVG